MGRGHRLAIAKCVGGADKREMWSVSALVCLILSAVLAVAVLVVFGRAVHERFQQSKIVQPADGNRDYVGPEAELLPPTLLTARTPAGVQASQGIVVPVLGNGYAEMALVLLKLLEHDDSIKVEVYHDHVDAKYIDMFQECGATCVDCTDELYTKYGLGVVALKRTGLDCVMLLDADVVVHGEVTPHMFADLHREGLVVFESQDHPVSCVTLVDRASLGEDFFQDYAEHHERIPRREVFHRLGGHVVSSSDEAGQGGHHNTDVFHYRGVDFLHRHRQRWPLVECAGSWDHCTLHTPDGAEDTVKFSHVYGKLDDRVMGVLRDVRARAR